MAPTVQKCRLCTFRRRESQLSTDSAFAWCVRFKEMVVVLFFKNAEDKRGAVLYMCALLSGSVDLACVRLGISTIYGFRIFIFYVSRRGHVSAFEIAEAKFGTIGKARPSVRKRRVGPCKRAESQVYMNSAFIRYAPGVYRSPLSRTNQENRPS